MSYKKERRVTPCNPSLFTAKFCGVRVEAARALGRCNHIDTNFRAAHELKSYVMQRYFFEDGPSAPRTCFVEISPPEIPQVDPRLPPPFKKKNRI